MEPKIDMVLVTPEMAKEWLERNTHNRNLRERKLRAMVLDMQQGDWKFAGDPIRFDINGDLQDGQHRLTALVRVGIPQEFMVITGLATEIRETIDQGTPRSFGDVLKLRGEGNCTTLASITRRVAVWQNDRTPDNKGMYVPTHAQLITTLEKYPDLREAAKIAQATSARCKIPVGTLGLTWWMFGQIDTSDRDSFFHSLRTGTNLEEGSPIAALRNVAMDVSSNPRKQLPQRAMTALIIKAWNKFREGEYTSSLRWKPGGANPERFPEAI
jgi:hypothetical protein